MLFSSVAARCCGRSVAAASGVRRALVGSNRIATAAKTNHRFLSSAAEVHPLKTLQAENPHTNVVHYTHKNLTFTVQQVDYYSEALAIGLAENGLTTGDVVLSWLPAHFAESMILQFACSKAGFVLYQLDPMIAVNDGPDAAQASLAQALELTKANVLISQEAGNDTNYLRIAERIIPELRFFDYASGMPFVTPHYPDLRICIHTGFDQDDKWGWLPYRHMMVPSNNLEQYITAAKTKNAPLAGTFTVGKDGSLGVDKVLTHPDVVASNVWPSYTKVLQREFHTVEGVGVVF